MKDKQSKSKGNFFMVPNSIFEAGLSPIQFCIYCYLLRCDNRQWGCFPSRSTIAKACGVAPSSVSLALNALEQQGLIERHHNFRHNRQINNSYRIFEPGAVSEPDRVL